MSLEEGLAYVFEARERGHTWLQEGWKKFGGG